jgi:hypothetical protein
MKAVGWILGAVFGGIGLIFLAIAAATFVSQQRFAAGAVRAEGTIVDDPGRPHVRFEAGSRAFEFWGSTKSSPPVYRAGDKVSVLYPASSPESAQIDSFFESYFLPTLMGGIGLPFGVIGGAFLFVTVRAARRRARALALGQKVAATVTAINKDTSVRSNGRSPWYLEATYADPESGKSYLFTSESVWTNPEATYPVGSEVTVFYLVEDPKTNAVVLDKLPEAV